MAGPIIGSGAIQVMPTFVGLQRASARAFNQMVPAASRAGKTAGAAAGTVMAAEQAKAVRSGSRAVAAASTGALGGIRRASAAAFGAAASAGRTAATRVGAHWRTQLDGIRNSTNSVGGSLRTMGAVALVATGAGLLKVGKDGLQMAADLQQARIGFETLLGSGRKADAFLAKVKAFAAKTPFELPGVVDASRQLLGVGLAADQVMPTLQSWGDAAGALGIKQNEFGNAMRAVSQMIGKGKVSQEEMLQITEAGIPVWSILSKAMGKPIPELQKMATGGKLLSKDVLPVLNQQMNKDYGGAMVKQSKTLTGVWSTFKDTVNLATADALAPLATWLGEKIPNAAGRVGGAITGASNGVKRFGSFISQYRGPIDTFAGGVKSVAAASGPFVKAFGGSLAGALALVLLSLRPVGNLLRGLGEWMGQNKTVVGVFGAVLGGIAGAILLVVGAMKAWAVIQAIMNVILTANPIGLIVIALAGLVAGLIYAYKNSETFRNIVQGVFRAVGAAATWVKNAAVTAFNGIRAGLSAVGSAVSWLWRTIIQPTFNFIATAGKLLFVILATVVLTPIKLALRAAGAVFRWLYANVVSPTFKGIATIAGWLWRTILAPILNLMKAGLRAAGAVFRWLNTNVVQPVFRAVASVVQWAWRNVVMPNLNAMKAGIRALGAVFTWLRDNIVRPVWNGIRSIISGVWGWIQSTFNKLRGNLKTLGTAFGQIKNAVKAAWDKIPGVAYRPINWFLENVYTRGIKQTFDKIAKAVKLNIKLPAAPVLGSYRTGGRIGGVGTGTSDSNLIRASRGEFMVKEQAAKKYGYRMLDALNRGALDYIPGYAGGGRVYPLKGRGKGRTYPGHSPAGSLDWPAPTGTKIGATEAGRVVTSGRGSWQGNYVQVGHAGGWRTLYAHMSKLVARVGQEVKAGSYLGNVGNTGNSFGSHLHMSAFLNGAAKSVGGYLRGAAASGGIGGVLGDLVSFVKDGFKKAKSVGSWLGDKGQAVSDLATNAAGALKHWIGDKVSGLVGKIPGQGTMLTKSLGATPKYIIEGLAAKAKSVASKLLPSYGAGPGSTGIDGGTPGKNQAIARKLMGSYGWGDDQWPALKWLWNKESGWNHKATNPSSGAYGIPQSLPGSKMRSAGADWRDNPETQIRWGLPYIKSRYKTPTRAQSFHRSHNWYDRGILGPGLPPGPSLVYNGTGNTEPVVTDSQWSTIRRAAAGGQRPSGGDRYEFNMRSIDLNERTFTQVQQTARMRQRVGRPS